MVKSVADFGLKGEQCELEEAIRAMFEPGPVRRENAFFRVSRGLKRLLVFAFPL